MSDSRLEMLLEWAFGFALLVVLGLIARGIALQDVQEAKSYGLPIVLNSLTGLGGAWGAVIVMRRKERKGSD